MYVSRGQTVRNLASKCVCVCICQTLQGQVIPDGSVRAVKMLCRFPADWRACVKHARVKFERYFNHSARTLLNAFPVDTKMKDGCKCGERVEEMGWEESDVDVLFILVTHTTHSSFLAVSQATSDPSGL